MKGTKNKWKPKWFAVTWRSGKIWHQNGRKNPNFWITICIDIILFIVNTFLSLDKILCTPYKIDQTFTTFNTIHHWRIQTFARKEIAEILTSNESKNATNMASHIHPEIHIYWKKWWFALLDRKNTWTNSLGITISASTLGKKRLTQLTAFTCFRWQLPSATSHSKKRERANH